MRQRKTPSKIFKLALKQHNKNSNNKRLARKRFDFTDSALEYDKLLEYSNYVHKWSWMSRFFTAEQASGRLRVWQHLPPNTPTRTFPWRLRVHLSLGWAWLWSFSTQSSEVTNGGIKKNKSTSSFWFSEFLRCLLFQWRWWTRDNETTPLYTNLDQHSGARYKENLNFKSIEHKGGENKALTVQSFLSIYVEIWLRF